MQQTAPIRAEQAKDAKIVPLALESPAERVVSAAASDASVEGAANGWPLRGSVLWADKWVRSLAIFTSGSALLIWVFRSEIGAAIEVWSSSRTFGHAFFIFPVTLFLFYRLRHLLATLEPKAAPWALLPIAGAMLFWTIGELANLTVVKQLAFVVVWQSLFLLVLGWRVAWASIFPLAYLYLAVPFGISVIPTLQNITAQIVGSLLRFGGVPVFLDGFHIEIPNGSFLVAEACSGVRYLMVCISLGILAAHLFFRSWRRRILFVALSVIVPVVANGIRAYGVVMLGYLGYHDNAVTFDHVVYGFLFLSVVTLCLLGLGAILRDDHLSPIQAAGHPLASRRTSTALETVTFGRSLQIICTVLAMVTVFSVHMWTTGAKAPPLSLGAILHAPAVGSAWILESGEPSWSPKFHGADAQLQQGYRRAGERVDLFVGYYVYQREGAEAVSDLNTLASRLDIKVLNSKRMTLQIVDTFLPIIELVILYRGKPFVVWSWYWTGGENTNSRLTGKLLEMKALATGGERAAAAIAVSAEVSEDVEETEALLNSFLQEGLSGNGALFKAEISSSRAALSEPEAPPNQTGGAAEP